MRYIFQVKAEENPEFSLTLQIDAEATFYELHQLIADSCGYDESQMASFFTVNAKGQRLQEVSLVEMSSEEEEVNVAVMDVAVLREFISQEVRQIEYLYDFFGDRFFVIKLEETQRGRQNTPVLLNKKGEVPEQTSLEGFADIHLGGNEQEGKEIDYQRYLDSFNDCKDEDVNFQSLDELEEEL